MQLQGRYSSFVYNTAWSYFKLTQTSLQPPPPSLTVYTDHLHSPSPPPPWAYTYPLTLLHLFDTPNPTTITACKNQRQVLAFLPNIRHLLRRVAFEVTEGLQKSYNCTRCLQYRKLFCFLVSMVGLQEARKQYCYLRPIHTLGPPLKGK